MQAKQTYRWATEMVEAVTKEHREQQACQRRLAQMQAKREKDAKRAARKQIVFAGTTGATDALGPTTATVASGPSQRPNPPAKRRSASA